MFKTIKSRVLATQAAVSIVACAASATTPVMDPVSFPVTLDSIATEMAAGGGEILALVFPIAIGFTLVWMLFRKIKTSMFG